jgi:hypothetical protein
MLEPAKVRSDDYRRRFFVRTISPPFITTWANVRTSVNQAEDRDRLADRL